MAPRRRPSHPLGVAAVRTWLPALLVVAAGVVLIVGPRGLAPGLLVTAMFVIVADWIIRIAMSSQTDRDVEESARDRFARYGHWPEDDDADPSEDAAPRDRSAHDAPHRTASHDARSDGSSASRRPRERRPPRRR